MTRVISFLNLQNGGGKTTTVLNLATALKRRGHSVLAIDLAPEETLSQRVRFSSSMRPAQGGSNAEGAAKIVATREGWNLMPAALSISLLHARTVYRLAPGRVFQDELQAICEIYDYVLVDCSTRELALMTEMLALTDEVIVPLDSESLQFHDAVDRLQELFAARHTLNPQLKFGGVFLAHYSPRVRRAREMLTTLFNVLGPVNCFSAYLRESDTVRQAEQRRVSVINDAPTSQAAHAFYQLAEQLTNAAVPRIQVPTLLVTPGRAQVDAEEWIAQPAFEPFYPAGQDLPTWKDRAETTLDLNQAVRYAVLALTERPDNPVVLEVFETRLTERLESATYQEVDSLVELGEFLAYHELDHYAAQLLRRAIDLNPAHLRAWADLSRVSHSDAERAYALQQCLGLDEGMAAGEAPPPARRAPRADAPSFASSFVSMRPANV